MEEEDLDEDAIIEATNRALLEDEAMDEVKEAVK